MRVEHTKRLSKNIESINIHKSIDVAVRKKFLLITKQEVGCLEKTSGKRATPLSRTQPEPDNATHPQTHCEHEQINKIIGFAHKNVKQISLIPPT